MARRKVAKKRKINPDPVFNSILVSKFINRMMLDGKKSASEKIFYKALDIAKDKSSVASMDLFEKAIDNVKPELEVKSRRVGGATYQVPIEVRPERQLTLALRWIITSARGRHERTMTEKLSGELLDAYNNTGGSIKKKEDTFKMAEANKAFAHYRW